MLIESNVPVLPELERERNDDFDTPGRGTEFSAQFVRSREIRNGIAKYLSLLPKQLMNEYPTSL